MRKIPYSLVQAPPVKASMSTVYRYVLLQEALAREITVNIKLSKVGKEKLQILHTLIYHKLSSKN